MMRLRPLAALALAMPVLAAGAERPGPTRIEVAEGVHLFMSPSYGDVGLDGNAVAIVSPEGVLVFDTNGTPAAADAVVAEIRKLTTQPVRYVVNSHWHWDHWYGTEAYRRAFPEATVIAHAKTRELMAGPAVEFNRPGLETQLPAYLASLEKRVAAAQAASPPPVDLPRLKQLLEDDRLFLEQKRAIRHILPDLTFGDGIELHLGGRRIQVLNYGRAVTPGDTFLYLPAERILIAGDLLVNPITFALSCYPTEWLRVLERIDALDAALIVPGHGQPLRDEDLLHATMGLFRELLRQGPAAKSKGLTVKDAAEAILPSLEELKRRITRGDPALDQAFRVQLVEWYLQRVYDEQDGPLPDSIAPIPRR